MEPQRLAVCGDDGERLVVADPWYPRLPELTEAIRYQAMQGKGELVRAGVGENGLWAVTDLDPDCHGPVLMCRSRAVADELRNALGSRQLEFTFELLVKDAGDEDARVCELPLARHREEPLVLVSHKTGKAAQTSFSHVESFGRYSLWQARTTLPRRDQVLVHAREVRLPVLGDIRYGRLHPLMLSAIKRGYQPRRGESETPVMDGPAYRLASIRTPDGVVFSTPAASRWRALVKQLQRHQ
jgi:23S rRNA-/tRNA-specific pseudouridylate synthase